MILFKTTAINTQTNVTCLNGGKVITVFSLQITITALSSTITSILPRLMSHNSIRSPSANDKIEVLSESIGPLSLLWVSLLPSCS